jgi:hypothetical protein
MGKTVRPPRLVDACRRHLPAGLGNLAQRDDEINLLKKPRCKLRREPYSHPLLFGDHASERMEERSITDYLATSPPFSRRVRKSPALSGASFRYMR